MPEIPEHAPKPQDRLKSKETREAESDDGFVTLEQCGVELRIPIGGKLPLKAFEAFDEGKELLGTKLMLGADQWAAFIAADPTIDDLAELGKKLQEATGE